MADLPDAPLSREEDYLASIAGQNVEVPPCPRSRKEAYLDAIDTKIDGIEQDIEGLKNNPDVVDIVDTYADLQAYDKTKLTDNDIIRVLNDETHDSESTYYRYSTTTQTWTYIGSAGGGGGGGPTVVQTTGTSTTDVMSQDATTKMVYPELDTKGTTAVAIGYAQVLSKSDQVYSLAIGASRGTDQAETGGQYAVAIGAGAKATNRAGSTTVAQTGSGNVAIGAGASTIGDTTSGVFAKTAIGYSSRAIGQGAVAIGASSNASQQGEMNIGTTQTSYGYNNTNYRLLTGLYDGQADHDAVNVSQVNAVIDAINTALSTNIPHIGA